MKGVEDHVVIEFHPAAAGVGEELADQVAGEEVFAGAADDVPEAGKIMSERNLLFAGRVIGGTGNGERGGLIWQIFSEYCAVKFAGW